MNRKYLGGWLVGAWLVLALAGSAWAGDDQIITTAIPFKNVTIKNVKEGKVQYVNEKGEAKTAHLNIVKKLVMKDQPQFTQAEEQFSLGQWTQAGRSYEEAVRRFSAPNQTGFRDYCYQKMIQAFSKGKAFDKMLEAYGAFRLVNPAITEEVLPPEKPAAGSSEMAAAIKVLEDKWGKAHSTADKQFWGNLLVGYYTENGTSDKASKLMAELEKLTSTATPAPSAGGEHTPAIVPSAGRLATPEGNLLIQKLELAARAGKWDDVLSEIEANSAKAGDNQLTDLQYFKGLAEFNKGEYAQAGVDFMWVWSCGYIKSPRRFWSLYYTGQVYQKLNKPQMAKELYQELLKLPKGVLAADLKTEVEKALKEVGG